MDMHTRTSDIGHSQAYICIAAGTGQILFIRLCDPDTSVMYSNTLESEIVASEAFLLHATGSRGDKAPVGPWLLVPLV
jgi:hypothetical protein